ncbi:MAG: Ig-like domain-containing protein, partial [Acidobacteriota bacterium]
MLQTLPPAALTRLNLLRGAAPTADRLFIAALAAFFLAAAPAPGGGQGFPNVERTAGELISGLNAPEQGRTAIIAYHHGVLYTIPESPSSVPPFDVQVRSWDLSDPADPQVLQLLGATTHPFDAHGYFKSGDYLVIGPNSPPEAPWSFRADGPAGTLERTTFPGLVPPVGRGAVFQPWSVNPTLWSYDAVGGSTSLFKDGQTLATWDHLGLTGVIGHPFILGDLLIFASDQSRTGVATYDIGDPANPVLLDVLTAGGAGGYWPEIWGGDGKLYVVFPYRTDGNGVRVVDATDPSDLAFIADVPLPGDEAMYAQFQDHYAFIGDHKVNLRTMQSVLFLDGLNTPRPDGGVGVSTSQFALPLGNLLITGGVGEFQGMAIWAHQDAPDSEGPTVGFHVPRDGAANYPLGSPISLLIHETLETPTIQNGVSFIVRPVGGQPISGRLSFSFDDVLTFTPDADLLPDTTYEVVLPDGGIEDAAGNGIEGYSFTFSTGSTVGGNGAPQLTGFAVTPYPALPGETANFTATAADPDGDGVEYRFDFGDGSPGTAWGAAAAAEHTYAAEGHYRATVQARDPSGALSTRAVTVTVRTPPAGPPPPRSTPVACHGAARRGYKVNPDNDTLTAFDLDTRAVVFEVPTCRDPRSVARAHTGELWVACHGGDAVRVHGADGAAVAELGTGYGSAPFGLVAAPSGEVYVSLYGTGEIRRYDAAARQDTGSLPVGPTPRALALTPDGARLFVSRFLSLENRAEIWEVDTAGFTVARPVWTRNSGGADHRAAPANGRGTANYLAGLAVDPL